MSTLTEPESPLFAYCIVRVVPDPIKDEAINIGVAVVHASGSGGRLEVHVDQRARSRIRAVQPRFDFLVLEWSLRDLETSLGMQRQPTIWEGSAPAASERALQDAAQRLNNQLQLTAPRRYAADTIDEATDRLFGRYVRSRPAVEKPPPRLTYGQLRDLIWRRVKKWDVPHHQVEQGGLLQGERATHPADIVIRNGRPRAGIFAVPTYQGDDHIPYLYRDRIPTIAADMGEDFYVYAVLPQQSGTRDERERRFAQETRDFLDPLPRVATVELPDLESIHSRIEQLPLMSDRGRSTRANDSELRSQVPPLTK